MEIESAGIEWVIRTNYDGSGAAAADDDLKRLTATQQDFTRASYQTARTTKMLAMSLMSMTMSWAAMSGATKEQTRALQAFALVLQTVMTLMLIMETISLFTGAGAVKGFGGLAARGMMGVFHQGGYGRDKLAVIRTDERVVPANQLFQSSNSSVSIGQVHVHTSGSGREFAKQFTEDLESLKSGGSTPPKWR